MELVVRSADAQLDAHDCAEIYAFYARDSHCTFEEVPPDTREFAERMAHAQAKHSWVIAEREGAVVGFAYGAPHNPRLAYRWSCTTAVYVHPAAIGQGVGARLYARLFDDLDELGYLTATAGVTLPNPASIALHERFGFEQAGCFRDIGFKQGRWWDVAWLQRTIPAGGDPLPVPPPEPGRSARGG